MLLSTIQISGAVQYLNSHPTGATVTDFIFSVVNLSDNPVSLFTNILHTFLDHEQWGHEARGHVLELAREQYSTQLDVLASKGSGWHFSALKAKARKIEDLDVETMLSQMEELAPDLCSLVGDLLSANKALDARRLRHAEKRKTQAAELKAKRVQKVAHKAGEDTARNAGSDEEDMWQSLGDMPDLEDIPDPDEDQELWAQLPNILAGDLENGDEDAYWRRESEPHMPEDPADGTSGHDEDRADERRKALLKIVRNIINQIGNELTY